MTNEKQKAWDKAVEARGLILPTADKDVRLALRLKGEPQTVFGEGPFERRERLRFVVQKKGPLPISASLSIESNAVVKADETFYTEGTTALKEVRTAIAQWSMYHAFVAKRAALANEDPEQVRADEGVKKEDGVGGESGRNRGGGGFAAEGRIVNESDWMGYDWTGYDCMSSVVADMRPLLGGAWDPSGCYLAAGGLSTEITLWNSSLTEHFKLVESHKSRVHHMHWNPRKREMLATCDGEGVIAIWRSETADDGVQLPNAESQDAPGRVADSEMAEFGRSLRVAARLVGHELRVNRLDFHPSGCWLASTSHDETWRYWDLEKELVLQEGHARGVYGLRHHPHGGLLATSDLGGIVRVWDLRTGKSVMELQKHVDQVLALDWHPLQSHILASAGGDKAIRVWDVRKLDCTHVLGGHKNLVSSLQFAADGAVFLTGSHDCTARIWHGSSYQCLKVLVGHEGFVNGASINPQRQICTTSFDRTVKLWFCPRAL
ncbi:putative U4/U6 small nuclear ribonucleoprotein PRP4 [Gregarina niphandrodes]|uniref:U4/U6 small nuclear ribonucleoprotein PRP4 n=1 Tax=Gregarina niphandrodes TaxID=110365 RepID=A0A023BAM0_GRENI|nr:putative U4/U6 small nuclear ribonucleoprotein PRP4 [Gregarina niphandrodes]EZG78432.1 putative U4/U6 small nuclear ribonucleoprotein PRP4 [Gregarina niphandrodes]|eukprot:XP_011129306.1 putative U4/U6 small nuclear ribonucleoprotein PRP4 [Gregarina niphandrodes]